MRIWLPLAVAVAVMAWILLYLIIGIQLWVAFVVAGAIIVLGLMGSGAALKTQS